MASCRDIMRSTTKSAMLDSKTLLTVNDVAAECTFTEDIQKVVTEELKIRRRYLERKNALLENAKVIIESEFSSLESIVQKVDEDAKRYGDLNDRFLKVVAKFISLQQDGRVGVRSDSGDDTCLEVLDLDTS